MFLLRHAIAWSNWLEGLALVGGLGLLASLAFLRQRKTLFVVLTAGAILLVASTIAARLWISFRVGSERLQTLQAMSARPKDPWPRGSGHVPLGLLGASPLSKSYIEPGGSFSPSAGSFGVSFWVLDASGRRVATSDDIPLSQTHQSYGALARPSISVDTPHYRATWQILDRSTSELELIAPVTTW